MISLLNYEFKKSMYPISILLTNFSILPLVHSSSQVIQNTSSDIYDIPEYVPFINQPEFTFEFVAKVQKDLWLKLLGVYDAIVNLCPNKRVVNLALHGKNNKIRKKNLHRAIKILEKEN